MIEPWLAPIITVVCSVAASGGFWAWLQTRSSKKDSTSKMLLGLGHDRILYLCGRYIDQGYITLAELENLNKYLYVPYKEMGGNGTVERLMEVVKSLPITQTIPKLKEEMT